MLKRRLGESLTFVVAPSDQPQVIVVKLDAAPGGGYRLITCAPRTVQIHRSELLDRSQVA